MRSCQRSEGTTVSRKNFRTLEHCISYARARNALAFNYRTPDGIALRRNKGDYVSSCQILSCPDIGFNNMVNDTGYDYYSIYKNLPGMYDLFCTPNATLNDMEIARLKVTW
ncbi:hypothetical protein Trydic_g7886 [Trypoxylus dichotomus]